jgi:hypothetical protein
MPLGRHVHTAMIIKYACLTEKIYNQTVYLASAVLYAELKMKIMNSL